MVLPYPSNNGWPWLMFLLLIELVRAVDKNNTHEGPQTHWEWQWCPCVQKPGSNECLQYDSKYQATSIDEAVDMTLNSNENLFEGSRKGCTQCSRSCERVLRQKLRSVGLIEDFSPTVDWAPTRGGECQWYRFSRQGDNAVYEYGTFSSSGGREEERRVISERVRRQSAGILGTRFNLSCVRKGVPEADGMSSLCSSCWTWRKLPSGYFPQFVNECICDDQDTTCLSGDGKCVSVLRTMDVIRTDLAKPTTVTIQARSYCECKIPKGSPLEKLATG